MARPGFPRHPPLGQGGCHGISPGVTTISRSASAATSRTVPTVPLSLPLLMEESCLTTLPEMNTLISRLTVWRTRILSLQNNLVEAPSDSDSGSGSSLGGSGGSPENNEPPLDLKASVDGLSGSGDASGKDSSFDTGNGTGTGLDSDADDNEDLIHLAPGVGSENLFEIAAGAGAGSDGCWRSREPLPHGGRPRRRHGWIVAAGGPVGGPQKLLDLFAGLGDEDGAYFHAQLDNEGLEIDIEIPGVGHMGIGPASEGTYLSSFWEAEVRFRKRIRLGPRTTGEGGDGFGCKGVVGGAVGVVGMIVAGIVDGLGQTVKKFLSRRCRGWFMNIVQTFSRLLPYLY
ncbi:hypothetical protein BGZ61DRAFT_478619 [Ilyonectria robusta]|uniref:uncharacterized protein n=1 Tax=Ilyonectria robusta TaxID=1079257 RepID=UPI001E8EE324|nr:uncharacterized protein BGZ61DRAFT_478619 [Ilyonectria robusta]KAH8688289.1 hypothetical protein BGZ61DRAFT_478619 [Ilyonectria robusta]